MYENRHKLRDMAKQALERQGFHIEIVRGSGGARLKLTKEGETILALVRTSSDRWVGWMRTETGVWRGLAKADLIVVASLTVDQKQVEVVALRPDDVGQAFTANLAAREAAMPTLMKTAPIFVALDEIRRSNYSAVGSNLKAKQLWRVVLPLPPVAEAAEASAPVAAAATALRPAVPEIKAGVAARLRQEFAAVLGVPVEQVMVEVEVRVSL